MSNLNDYTGPFEYLTACVDCGREFTTLAFTPGGPRVCLDCSPSTPRQRKCMRCREPLVELGKGCLCAGCEQAVLETRERIVQRARAKRQSFMQELSGRDRELVGRSTEEKR